MLNFWSVINCIFVHWMKKLILAFLVLGCPRLPHVLGVKKISLSITVWIPSLNKYLHKSYYIISYKSLANLCQKMSRCNDAWIMDFGKILGIDASCPSVGRNMWRLITQWDQNIFEVVFEIFSHKIFFQVENDFQLHYSVDSIKRTVHLAFHRLFFLDIQYFWYYC